MIHPEFDYSGRIERARMAMESAGIDVLLASVGSDLPYLTGYEAMPLERLTMAVIPRDGDAMLVVPELEAPRIVARPDVFTTHPWSETEDPIAVVAAIAGSPRTVAISDQTWSVFLLALQKALPQADFVSARPLSRTLRTVKEPAEIELLGLAGAAVDRVAARLATTRFGGKSEHDLSMEVAAMTVDEGHDVNTFRIVASGPNGASPHHEASDRIIQIGDSVVVDFGGKLGGYCSDTTRTFHVGRPTAEYREVYAVVQAAQQAGFQAAVPGAVAGDVDAAARSLIDEAGYGHAFFHRLGHGIGLDGHEDPYLIEGNAERLQPGMAFSIEPGIYLAGRFGVRIEDIVVCEETGPRRLNTSNHDLVIVE